MFIDENILKIVARAGNLKPEETTQLAFWYASKILDAISYAGLEHYFEMDPNLYINNISEMSTNIERIFKELKDNSNPELAQKIKDEIDKLDKSLLEFFLNTASYGDRLFLKVYLASKIKNLKNKIHTNKKPKNINFLPQKFSSFLPQKMISSMK